MQNHLILRTRLFGLLVAVFLSFSTSVFAQTAIFFDGFEGGTSFSNRPAALPQWTLVDFYDIDNPDPGLSWDIAGPIRKDTKGNIYFGSGDRGMLPHTGTNIVYCAKRGYEGTNRAPIYPNYMSVRMITTNFSAKGYTTATLSFWYKLKIPDAFSISASAIDGDILSIYVDDNPLAIWDTFELEKSVNTWTKVNIPLDLERDPEENPDDLHTISFEFFSDGDNPIFNKVNNPDEWIDGDEDQGIEVKEKDYEGVYIDDVLISGVKAPFLPDFNEDGASDLVFQAPDGRMALWFVDQTTFQGGYTLRNGTSPGSAWKLVGFGNFDKNDSTLCPDLLLQNTNGSLASWYFNYGPYFTTNRATAVTNSITLKTNITSTNIVTRSPVNSTNPVTITTRNIVTNSVIITTNITVVTNAFITGGVIKSTNKVAIFGTNRTITTNLTVINFTNNPPTTNLTVTSTNRILKTSEYIPRTGTNIVKVTRPYFSKGVTLKKTTPGWRLAALADINKDGNRDFLFQGSDGRIAFWRMDGTNFLGSGFITGTNNAPKVIPSGYKLVGAVDYNSDGEVDLLLQRLVRGDFQIWLMSGTKQVNITSFTQASSITFSPSLRLAGLVDYEGDGSADLLMQHTDGRVFIWYVDTNRKITHALPVRGGVSVGATWTLVGPR